MTKTSSSSSPPSSHGGGGIFSRKSVLWNPKLRDAQDSALTLGPAVDPHAFEDKHSSNSSTRSKRRESSLHSLTSSVTEFGTSVRRSVSLRSPTESGPPPSYAFGPPGLPSSLSPKKRSASAAGHYSRPGLSVPGFSRKKKSSESVDHGHISYPEGAGPKGRLGMLVAPFGPKSRGDDMGKPSSNAYASSFSYSQTGSTLGPPVSMSSTSSSSQNPNTVYQHIHDMATKRISTLDYLRKAHEGRIYWFNTLHFTKADLSRLSYFESRKLARRATNYLLLGYSIPTILDLNSQTPIEYLRALNALLTEFESYQTLHPPDAPASSSLSRARIPQMFKRATAAATASSKSRRTSSAAQSLASSAATAVGSDNNNNSNNSTTTPIEPSSATDAWPDASTFNGLTTTPTNGSGGTAGGTATYTSPTESLAPDALLPNESYTHLLTPSLPFEPDFFETFATLCDVLIDTYGKILSLLERPEHVAGSPGVGELFAKADAKVRKVLVAGVVREFEEASRVGARGEVGGVGRVVLAGLM
ncbi:MAG: hypothetical protein M1822_003549 [Bathelium mastoideum]|nr:MAG: hypothetical protein M1822_003549 [Bathelium mastoideum]